MSILMPTVPLLVDTLQSILNQNEWPSQTPITNHEEGVDEVFLDIRLRCHSSGWQVLTGDASYDTDHRGHWSAGCIWPGMNTTDLTILATTMLAEVQESMHELGPIVSDSIAARIQHNAGLIGLGHKDTTQTRRALAADLRALALFVMSDETDPTTAGGQYVALCNELTRLSDSE